MKVVRKQINDISIVRSVALYLNRYDSAVLLRAGNRESPAGDREVFFAGAGVSDEISGDFYNERETEHFLQKYAKLGRRVYAHFSYDLKNSFENLDSVNNCAVPFSTYRLFVPQVEIEFSGSEILVSSEKYDPENILEEIIGLQTGSDITPLCNLVYFPDKNEYLSVISNILENIRYGNIYEMNFCHQVLLKAIHLDPVSVFKNLYDISPNPFSVFYREGNNYLLCASPERFISKTGNKVTAQPVKGTAPRSDDPETDVRYAKELFESEKERAENVMIVDLVRNDMSKFASRDTVVVDELFGIKKFARSHQMVSTISCEAKQDISFSTILKAMFPMGSMTGAPKVKAMQLTDSFEKFKRGLYSGSVGYIEPSGDFDFNVVIRSILYNSESGNVSVAAGGAITAKSNPEDEYQETLIKLSPQLSALGIQLENITDKLSDKSHA